MKKMLTIFMLVIALTLSACSSSAPRATADSSAPSSVAPSSSAAAMAPSYSGEFDNSAQMSDGSRLVRESTESYLTINENHAQNVDEESVTTFSLKVDTASYNNVERYIRNWQLPPVNAVRTEELINYFSYDAQLNFNNESPFAVYTEVGPSPFDSEKLIAFLRVKTKELDKEELPPSNLTFLIDTSGSMNSHDKLPLLQKAFNMLVDTLGEDDRVSIVTYAGSSAVVLDSAYGNDSIRIKNAINSLEAGGSTAGADGIMTAYKLAEKNFIEGGNNRIILSTDGDFNVGISNLDELSRLISQKRDSGVYLSVLGFGTGNIRDDIMETLSRDGNGNYAYINSVAVAEKVLIKEMGSNLFTVADDVKAQVEFNPANVKSYRLIGYENRALANKDFENDSKDAGEIGAGADVIAMFELELVGSAPQLKYGDTADRLRPADIGKFSDELFELRIRYKNPGEDESRLITIPVKDSDITNKPSSDFDFACAVAAFGHLLRGSEYSGNATTQSIIQIAEASLGRDKDGYRLDFLQLLEEYSHMVK